jgi:hypothetical protein
MKTRDPFVDDRSSEQASPESASGLRSSARSKPNSGKADVESGIDIERKIDIAVFRDWIMASVAPPPLREDMLSRIERYRPEDLSAMIDIVHRAELSCLAGLRDFHQNTRNKRQGQANGGRQESMSIIVYAEVASSWDQKIKWLQEVRQYLMEEQRRCAHASALTG